MSTDSQNENESQRSSQFNNNGSEENEAQRSIEVHEVKKSSATTKVMLAGAAVLVLGVVGYFGMILLNPPQQKPQQTNPPKVESPAPSISAPAPSQPEPPVATEPSATTTVDPLASNDPLASLGGAPLNTPPVNPEANQNANDPLASLGGAASPGPAPVVAQDQPSPAVENAQPSPAVSQPTVTPPVSSNTGSTADLAQAVGSAVTAAIRPVVERIDSMETKFDNRLTALETGKAVAVRETPASNEVRVPAKKPVARKPVAKKKVAPKPSKNTIEILDASPSVVAASPSVSSSAVKSVDKSECRVSAVLDGVAWLKSSDGKFTAISTGDSLPDGRKATSITAEKGIVVNGKAWNCD